MHIISIHALRIEPFQSTLSMRRATHTSQDDPAPLESISIHALHEESDFFVEFSRAGSVGFQSTLSMRRATESDDVVHARADISIHALHEESDP